MEQIAFDRCTACNRQRGDCTGPVADPLKFAQVMPDAGRGNQVVRSETVASISKNAIGKLKANMLRTALWLCTNEVVCFLKR